MNRKMLILKRTGSLAGGISFVGEDVEPVFILEAPENGKITSVHPGFLSFKCCMGLLLENPQFWLTRWVVPQCVRAASATSSTWSTDHEKPLAPRRQDARCAVRLFFDGLDEELDVVFMGNLLWTLNVGV